MPIILRGNSSQWDRRCFSSSSFPRNESKPTSVPSNTNNPIHSTPSSSSQGSPSSQPSPNAPPKNEPPSNTTSASAGFMSRRFPRITAAATRISSHRSTRFAFSLWNYRRPIAFGFFVTYAGASYLKLKRDAYLRDYIHPETYLVWKIHDGSIVESRGAPTLNALLSAPSSGEEAPRVMELFEVIRALKWAQRDERVKGIFADFSGLHLPSSVTPSKLGMAQIEELIQAIHEFKVAKKQQFGKDARPSIAWADTFDSQGSYLLASAFDEVYLQPSGQVPLVGLGAQIPFFKKVLDYFGVKVHAEARKEYKSMISTFNQSESLPPAQIQNEAELLGELNRGMMHAIGVNRFPEGQGGPEQITDKVTEWAKEGPFSSREATKLGLIDGTAYKRDIVKRLVDPESGGNEETKFKSLHHYNKVNDRALDKHLKDDEILEVGVVYLLGTISNAPGEFSTSSVIKGLKEAAEDESIKSIVLRIDSGGGDVVASESIWDAVRRVREEYGKPVIASFGNAAASGGYYAASAADAIVACENTITGSIGVASIRPTITRKFFEKFNLGIQSFFTGSNALSTLHEMDEKQLDRHSRHIDEMYQDFLDKVCQGRSISKDVIDSLAGGRVMTGLSAWARCNPDAEVDQVSLTKLAQDVIKAGEDAKKSGGKGDGGDENKDDGAKALEELVKDVASNEALGQIKKVKAVSLSSVWKASDVTLAGGNSTIMIERVGSLEEEKSVTDGDTNGPKQSEQALEDGSAPLSSSTGGDGAGGEAETPVGAGAKEETPEEFTNRLVAEAHKEAEESRSEKEAGQKPPTSSQGQEDEAAALASKAKGDEEERVVAVGGGEKALGPFGKGLVDSIGGIWDSAYYAMTIALQAEIEEMITKQGLTIEQATATIRPGCQREVTEDGTLALATDL
ncbi:hypothetical protein IE53DRAFT_286523 [Violaceomyces palustris]|uniref:Uncharacterized protein n=1 Tax=Violaceomyces palustris TaxID=1673888 RepID=A0ACD0NM18_9BASI|nr:hypothetical protein IE53DRAFT_286523 [Violaceomyces palustris]